MSAKGTQHITPEQKHKEVIAAYRAGANIEGFNEFHQEWVEITRTGFAITFRTRKQYRIAADQTGSKASCRKL